MRESGNIEARRRRRKRGGEMKEKERGEARLRAASIRK